MTSTYIQIQWNIVGCVAQLAERRSLAGELTLSCARPSADEWPLCG